MTDLELTKLCAEALYGPMPDWHDFVVPLPKTRSDTAVGWPVHGQQFGVYFDPLHDDAQAMQLVKRFRPDIRPDVLSDVVNEPGQPYNLFIGGTSLANPRPIWVVSISTEEPSGFTDEFMPKTIYRTHRGQSTDLNRAIVECVAHMQAAKVTA